MHDHSAPSNSADEEQVKHMASLAGGEFADFSGEYSAKNQSIISCHVCGGLSPDTETHCAACDSEIHVRKTDSIQRTIALLITASILLIPANVMPIMLTSSIQGGSAKTIFGGVVLFWHHGDYIIAAIIFIASVMIPLAKIIALSWLCLCAKSTRWSQPFNNTKIYRITELLGRWSMIDVFVVALLVGLIQIEGIVSIKPGTAVVAFAGAVVATMLAAMSFDTRILWDKWEESKQKHEQH